MASPDKRVDRFRSICHRSMMKEGPSREVPRRSPMKKTIAICSALVLAAVIAAVPPKAQGKQEKPVDTSKDVQSARTGLDEGAAKALPIHYEHHGFMQEGMHHAVAKGVTLDAKVETAAPYRERCCITWRSGTRIAPIFSASTRKNTFLVRAAR